MVKTLFLPSIIKQTFSKNGKETLSKEDKMAKNSKKNRKPTENPKIPTVRRDAVAGRTAEIMKQNKCSREVATAQARTEINTTQPNKGLKAFINASLSRNTKACLFFYKKLTYV